MTKYKIKRTNRGAYRNKYKEYKKAEEDLTGAKDMLSKGGLDDEIKELAKMEISDLEDKIEKLSEELKILLLPKDEQPGQVQAHVADERHPHPPVPILERQDHHREDQGDNGGPPHRDIADGGDGLGAVSGAAALAGELAAGGEVEGRRPPLHKPANRLEHIRVGALEVDVEVVGHQVVLHQVIEGVRQPGARHRAARGPLGGRPPVLIGLGMQEPGPPARRRAAIQCLSGAGRSR